MSPFTTRLSAQPWRHSYFGYSGDRVHQAALIITAWVFVWRTTIKQCAIRPYAAATQAIISGKKKYPVFECKGQRSMVLVRWNMGRCTCSTRGCELSAVLGPRLEDSGPRSYHLCPRSKVKGQWSVTSLLPSALRLSAILCPRSCLSKPRVPWSIS